jgi:predicted MFS family arabinose efflux permease
MMPQSPKRFVYALIAVGFACLIGSYVLGKMAADPNADTTILVSFLLTAAGTAAFVFAGIMAMRMLRSGGWR